jgi:hypothetical protein
MLIQPKAKYTLCVNDLKQVLKLIQVKNWTLGTFLCDIFLVQKVQKKDGNLQMQTQMILIFLESRKVKVQSSGHCRNDVCELI